MTTTPKSTTSSHTSNPSASTTTYLSYPVSHVFKGVYRRLTEPSQSTSSSRNPSPSASSILSPPSANNTHNGIYTPPHRTASPFQPPPLTPLTLVGGPSSSSSSSSEPEAILSKALAEEIRLLVPPRLQLAERWGLVYNLEEDGVSLATLYKKCAASRIPRGSSFVLVVRDGAGGIFGAYLTDPPHPSASYYGTGECFLWRASLLPTSSLLMNLPPPPSESDDATLPGRSTTIASPTSPTFSSRRRSSHLSPLPTSSRSNHHIDSTHSSSTTTSNTTNGHTHPFRDPSPTPSTSSQPPLIRFKAFPYSGINDYLIFCESSYLSVGGGDGKYGLWLDEVLERGVSASCLTFGNEGLSEEGEKFEVQGVEVWCVGWDEGGEG